MTTSRVFLAGLLACTAPMAAAATTEREAFQKLVAKVAAPLFAKPKGLCVCSFDSGPGFQNRVGVIRQALSSNQVVAVCEPPVFDAAGNRTGSSGCPDFVPLVK